jgi:cobalt-precorrin 5A hydrolase
MIIGGIGCRKGASAAEIGAAIEAACVNAGVAKDRIGAIATSAHKDQENGIADAAAMLGVPLILVGESDLRDASRRVTTRSERVQELIGVPSVAEAAALAAGGPRASLLAARIAVGAATCARGVAAS